MMMRTNELTPAPMVRDRTRRPDSKRADLARKRARMAKRWRIGAALPSPAFA